MKSQDSFVRGGFKGGLYEFGMILYYNSIPFKTKSVILQKQTNNYI